MKKTNPFKIFRIFRKLRFIKIKKSFFIALLLAFFISEMVLSINPYIGVLIYIIIIGFVLFDLEEYEFLNNNEKLLIFLMILPIARISELFIEFGFFWKTTLFYFFISFLVIFYTRKFKINPGYKTNKLWLFLISLAIGLFLGYIGNSLFEFEKNINILFLLPFIAFSEEILFRGMIQNHAKKQFGSLFAVIFTSILFAIFSLSFGFKLSGFMLVSNIIICLIYNQTENIWLTIPINLCINLLLFILPVSSYL